jgi:ABC-type bacteriocin/lantibiotic exporter with double-glycine peptidase domain
VQRIAIARTLARKARILLLDEPASYLDRISDERLAATLTSLRGHSTIILVSHRPSHLALADRVFQLGQGRLLREMPADHLARKHHEATP